MTGLMCVDITCPYLIFSCFSHTISFYLLAHLSKLIWMVTTAAFSTDIMYCGRKDQIKFYLCLRLPKKRVFLVVFLIYYCQAFEDFSHFSFYLSLLTMKWNDCRSRRVCFGKHKKLYKKRTVKTTSDEKYQCVYSCKSCYAVFSRTEKIMKRNSLFFRPPRKVEKKLLFFYILIIFLQHCIAAWNSSNSESIQQSLQPHSHNNITNSLR